MRLRLQTAAVLSSCLLFLPRDTRANGPPGIVMSSPPMGFMSWERFRCQVDCKRYPGECVNEDLYMTMADTLVEYGYRDVGYTLVSIDDCWSSKERTLEGKLQADPDRFPNGIAALSEYLHSRGLKLGMYGDAGSRTCQGYPGSWNYQEVDAVTFSEWGVNYLKLDGCHLDKNQYEEAYIKFGNAIKKHPMLYSCSWPAYLGNNETSKPYHDMYYQAGCNTWRNWKDVDNTWQSVYGIIMHWADYWRVLRRVPLHSFNDADMLLAGDDHYNHMLSLDKAKVQMSFWCMISSPLFIGGDVRTITSPYRDVLLNRHLIRVNQDAGRAECLVGCRDPTTHASSKEQQIWVKTLAGATGSASYVFGFFNLGNSTTIMSVSYRINDGDTDIQTRQVQCRDLWKRQSGSLCSNNGSTMTLKDSWRIRYTSRRIIKIRVRVGPTSQRMLQVGVESFTDDGTTMES